MTKKNCHTCKGLYTENQKRYYCNIRGKKPNDANLLLKWYEDHEITKPDLPCKDYAESISKHAAAATPAHSPDPWDYYDNLCGFLQNWGCTYGEAKYLIKQLKSIHQEDHFFELSDNSPVLLIYNCATYGSTKSDYKYDRWLQTVVESNDNIHWTQCKRVA